MPLAVEVSALDYVRPAPPDVSVILAGLGVPPALALPVELVRPLLVLAVIDVVHRDPVAHQLPVVFERLKLDGFHSLNYDQVALVD